MSEFNKTRRSGSFSSNLKLSEFVIIQLRRIDSFFFAIRANASEVVTRKPVKIAGFREDPEVLKSCLHNIAHREALPPFRRYT